MLQRPTAMEPTPRSIESEARELELSLREGAALARDSFRAFRKLMRPEMIHNWWTDEVA